MQVPDFTTVVETPHWGSMNCLICVRRSDLTLQVSLHNHWLTCATSLSFLQWSSVPRTTDRHGTSFLTNQCEVSLIWALLLTDRTRKVEIHKRFRYRGNAFFFTSAAKVRRLPSHRENRCSGSCQCRPFFYSIDLYATAPLSWNVNLLCHGWNRSSPRKVEFRDY